MEFGTLDFNNLVLLGIAVIGLINTVLTLFGNKTATDAKDIAIETRDNTKVIAVKTKEERKKMEALFDEALGSMIKIKNGRRK